MVLEQFINLVDMWLMITSVQSLQFHMFPLIARGNETVLQGTDIDSAVLKVHKMRC